MKAEIVLKGRVLEIRVPFHKRFPSKLREKTSKCYWDSTTKTWVVELEDESDVRGALWALQFCGFITREEKIQKYRKIVDLINRTFGLNWPKVW